MRSNVCVAAESPPCETVLVCAGDRGDALITTPGDVSVNICGTPVKAGRYSQHTNLLSCMRAHDWLIYAHHIELSTVSSKKGSVM